LDPVVGRDREIEQVIDILGKRRTNNPCLVGEAGVGKTAVVEGVAQKLRGLKGQLGQCAVFELDVGSLVAGTQLRGSLSERIFALKDEVRAADGRVVVFIDELHTLVGAGATGEGAQDASNELKTALARGEFPCIGATTHDEYQAHVLSDPALERRFTRVVVPEPTVQQTVAILKGLVTRYEAHHRLRFSHAAVEAIPALAARYIPDRHLPDKALAVLDLAGSRGHREGKTFVQLPDVARVVAQVAGIPEHRLLVDESQRLLKLEEALAARVVGHAESLRAVAQVIRRNYAGFSSQRPMGSFLVLGPTGVGKTELARALADVLFGSRDALVRVDMSEFSEPHAVSRLVGSPAGYVGHAEGGQLTEAVRRRPSCVVLLDEIEKAHRGAWMLLLQLLEEGQLTDGRGRHINFSHSVVLLTSNLGAEAFSGKKAAAPARAEALATAQRVLPPELWNRLDERLVFEPLGEADVARVARLLIRDSAARLAAEKSIHYEVDDAVVPYLLANGGYDAGLGARPLRQAVQRLLEAPLADRVLAGTLKSGDRVRVEVRWGALHFEHAAR
jgi:ATP-dependent Clp protease ATP-binding subunit ClpC